MDDQEAIFATLERLGLPYRLLEHAPRCAGWRIARASPSPWAPCTPRTSSWRRAAAGRNICCCCGPLCALTPPRFPSRREALACSLPATTPSSPCCAPSPGPSRPWGLCLPGAGPVRLLVDKGLDGARRLCFHPLVPNRTVVLDARDFFDRFLPAVGANPFGWSHNNCAPFRPPRLAIHHSTKQRGREAFLRRRAQSGRPRLCAGGRLAIGRQVFFREEASKPDRKPEAAPRARSPRITVRGSSLPSRAQYSPTPSAI